MARIDRENEGRQFGLRSLFFWTTLIAVCLLPFAAKEMSLLYLAFPLVMLLLTATKRIPVAIGPFLTLCGLVVMIFLIPPIKSHRQVTVRPACSNKIRQIALALLNYESAYGHFPPAYTVDDDGNRLHSWRTLILPFLEEYSRYEKIDLTLPWDHPTNAALAWPVPECYRCSKDKQTKGDLTTPFVGIVGKDLFWKDDGQTSTFFDLNDGSSNTICVIELHRHRVPWMAPDDLQYIELLKLMRDPNFDLTDGPHESGTNVGLVDGSVRWLKESTSHEALKSALRTDDGYIADF